LDRILNDSLTINTLAKHIHSKLPDDGCITETCSINFNVNFNVNFSTPLEQSNCALCCINKKFDSISKNLKKRNLITTKVDSMAVTSSRYFHVSIMCPFSYLLGIWDFLWGYSGLNVKLTVRHVVQLVHISLCEKLKRNLVEPVYNDIGLYDTSPIASDTL